MNRTYRLLISCKDCPGIVARVTEFLFERNLNVTELDQHATERSGGEFFLRLEFQAPAEAYDAAQVSEEFRVAVAEPYGMRWRLRCAAQRRKMAILASKTDHAPLELLWRWRNGEFEADVSMVISNHEVLREDVERLGIPYHFVSVQKGKKAEAEAEILGHLKGHADLVVLARYMQILSPEFVGAYRNRMINIHHSFLPAFVGADPYGQAHRRGVKLIGATAHYVTEDLDEGPIIEQGVARVSHRTDVQELRRQGRSIEKDVLARAVRWHLEDRVLVHGNKTIVFA